MLINAKTKIYCIVGNPTKHSLSPVMHNAGFDALKLNSVYVAFEPKNIGKTINCFKDLGVSGFNVTSPFKEEVMHYLDRIDSTAKAIGSVDTVVNENGLFIGYTTDGQGAINALKEKIEIKGKKVLLIGAGGAAKAIAFYLRKERAITTIISKSGTSAVKLAGMTGAKSTSLNSLKDLKEFEVVINASPVGMNSNTTPINQELLHNNLVVFDLVYSPIKTRLLKEAEKKGCKTISGVEMLLEQGYVCFKLFTNKNPAKREMKNAVVREL